jgi:hypothetical protein
MSTGQMEREVLIRKLNSVGREKFVNYYYVFKDYANNRITRASAIQKLVDQSVSNEAGASMRLGNAKIIFDGKVSCEALMIVQESRKLSEQVIRAAKKLLKEECD